MILKNKKKYLIQSHIVGEMVLDVVNVKLAQKEFDRCLSIVILKGIDINTPHRVDSICCHSFNTSLSSSSKICFHGSSSCILFTQHIGIIHPNWIIPKTLAKPMDLEAVFTIFKFGFENRMTSSVDRFSGGQNSHISQLNIEQMSSKQSLRNWVNLISVIPI